MSKYEELFEDSYGRVVGHGEHTTSKGSLFFSRFYEHFFDASDEIRDKFAHTDMASQVSILQKSMYYMISFQILKTENDSLRRIAKTHKRTDYDIKPEYYDLWLEALITTVREMDTQFNREIELAWRLTLTPGILYLKMHYDDD